MDIFQNILINYEKQIFFELLEQFKENKITVGNILSKISPIIFRFNNTYLASQTYFFLYSDVQTRVLFQKLNKKDDVDEFNSQ